MAKKLTATQKLRRNVMQQIRRLEKRGYRIDTGLKEDLKKANYSRLKSFQKNKYSRLYSQATAEEDGKVVTGTEKRKIERSESAKKSAITRKRAKEKEHRTKSRTYSTNQWERYRREIDETQKRLANQISEGEIVLSNIEKLIEQYPTKGSNILSKELTRQIGEYGRDTVAISMTLAPSNIITSAQQIIFYEGSSEEINRAIQDFLNILRGTIPTSEEAKETGELLDDMTDFEDED